MFFKEGGQDGIFTAKTIGADLIGRPGLNRCVRRCRFSVSTVLPKLSYDNTLIHKLVLNSQLKRGRLRDSTSSFPFCLLCY